MTGPDANPVGPSHGFGLYVHWPYCARICPYCDFNVYAAKDRDTSPLVDAICEDIRRHAARLAGHPPLTSVFFGGGTPSLLPARDIERIMTTAQDVFGLDDQVECSIEANPNDIDAGRLAAWHGTGLNRISIGVQSLDDDALAFLGRDHDSHAARAAIEATAARFDNFSLDLIYARPGQELADWTAELEAVLQWAPPHLSLYELTIEAATPFGKRVARGALVPMDEDRQADLYEATQAICEAAGLPAYEVSNHARGPRFQSRHNRTYWASGDWIGVGPGAHGRLTLAGKRLATQAHRQPAAYIGNPEPSVDTLPALDIIREFVAMGLRDKAGLDLERLGRLGHAPGPRQVGDLVQMDLLTEVQGRLVLTPAGRLLADRITETLSP